MIDEFFAGEIDLVEKGISRRFSPSKPSSWQLWFKAMAGREAGHERFTSVPRRLLPAEPAAWVMRYRQIEIVGEDASEEEPKGNHV